MKFQPSILLVIHKSERVLQLFQTRNQCLVHTAIQFSIELTLVTQKDAQNTLRRKTGISLSGI